MQRTGVASLLSGTRRILWLRRRLLMAWARQEPVWCVIAVLVTVAAGLSMVASAVAISGSAHLLALGVGHRLLEEAAQYLGLGFFVLWVAIGIFRGEPSSSISLMSQLTHYPIRITNLYLAGTLVSLLGPSLVLGTAAAIVALTFLFPLVTGKVLWALASGVALFAVSAHLLLCFLNLLIDGLAQRAISRIRSVVWVMAITIACAASSAVIDGGRRPTDSVGTTAFLPSELAVDLVFAASEGALLASLGDGALLMAYCLFFGVGGYFAFRANCLRSANARKKSEVSSFSLRLLRTLSIREGRLPTASLAVATKELIVLVRTKRIWVVFIPYMIWVLAVPSIHLWAPRAMTAESFILVVLATALVYPVFYNSFGLEGTGILATLSAPVPRRDVILGKNLALLALLMTALLPGLVLSLTASAASTTWWERSSFLLILAQVVLLHLSVGNLGSVAFPRKIPYDRIVGRYLSVQSDVLATCCMVILTGILGTEVWRLYLPDRDGPMFTAGMVVNLAALTCCYAWLLPWAARVLGRRTERFLTGPHA